MPVWYCSSRDGGDDAVAEEEEETAGEEGLRGEWTRIQQGVAGRWGAVDKDKDTAQGRSRSTAGVSWGKGNAIPLLAGAGVHWGAICWFVCLFGWCLV